jgi:hypothetical protein
VLVSAKAGIFVVAFHKRVLEWQAEHPNITWAVRVSFGLSFWCFSFGLERPIETLRVLINGHAHHAVGVVPSGRLRGC